MSESMTVKTDGQVEKTTLSSDEFNCPICLCDVPRTDVFFLKRCGCEFCRTCLSEFVQLQIDEQTIQRLKCPGLHIKDMHIRRDEIKNLVSRENFLIYVRLKHEQVVMEDPSRVFCPWPDCGAVCYSKRLGPQPTRCMTCGYKFCRLCLNSWPGHNHICPEELAMLVKPESIAQISQSEGPPDTEEEETKPEPNTNEIASGQEQVLAVKRCPKCGIPIERAAGCHQIYCMNCGHSFCWSCMASLDHEGYMQHVLEGKCMNGIIPVDNRSCCVQCVACVASTSMIGGIGIVALLFAPLIIVFSPCLALGLRFYVNQMTEIDAYNHNFEPDLGTNTLANGSVDEDTDNEMDFAAQPLSNEQL